MPADANIFQTYLRAPKSVIEYQADYDQADARKNALQQSVQALQKGQMDLQNAADVNRQRNALRDAVTSGQLDLSDPMHAQRALAIAPDVAPALLKTVQESATSRALASKDNAQATHFGAQTDAEQFKTRVAKSDQAVKDISALKTPQDALASLQQHIANGDIDPAKAEAIRASIPQDPSKFPAWQLGMVRNIMSAKEQMEYMAPTANTVANNATSVATNAATNATSRANNAATNATSRANNADTIKKDYGVAGINADGSINPGMEAQAQLIAAGKQAAPSGMAAARPGVGALMARVSQINPNYDATDYAAKLKAARDFTTGTQGNSMRSFAVAGQHLDQLGTLVDALDNGNTQLVNKIGNMYSQQTGSPAVTNFDAAKDVVSKEVVKAIVAGGGGVSEREELSKLMDSAKSPKQLKGVINQYRSLMAAQHDALLQQRDAAGLPRSTLPNYTDANGTAAAPAVPSDIDAILKKHGGK